jgi:hypothetical protein
MNTQDAYKTLTSILFYKKRLKYVALLLALLFFLFSNLPSQQVLYCSPMEERNNSISRLMNEAELAVYLSIQGDSIDFHYDDTDQRQEPLIAIYQGEGTITATRPLNAGSYITATGQMTGMRNLVIELSLADGVLEVYDTYDGSKQRTSWRRCN